MRHKVIKLYKYFTSRHIITTHTSHRNSKRNRTSFILWKHNRSPRLRNNIGEAESYHLVVRYIPSYSFIVRCVLISVSL